MRVCFIDKLFPEVVVSRYICTVGGRESQSLPGLTDPQLCQPSHERVVGIVVLLCVSLIMTDVEHLFHMHTGHSVFSFDHFKDRFHLLITERYEFAGHKPFVRYWDGKCTSQAGLVISPAVWISILPAPHAQPGVSSSRLSDSWLPH